MNALRLKRKHRKAIPLTDNEKYALWSAMWSLWEEIGGDAEQAASDAGVPLKNSDLAEFVLDASRLEEFAVQRGDTALEIALSKFRTKSWQAQVRFLLARHTLA